MKVAVPITKGLLSPRFGRCEQLALFDVDPDDKMVRRKQVLEPPPHEPGVLPSWLHELGANVVIAGGMGAMSQDLLTEKGVTVVTGAPSERPEQLVRDYLRGALEAGGNTCE